CVEQPFHFRCDSGVSSSPCTSSGTRYCSLAQAPRSTILQRSEQNGRKRFSSFHSTSAPQCGHSTIRGDFTEKLRLKVAQNALFKRIILLFYPSGYSSSYSMAGHPGSTPIKPLKSSSFSERPAPPPDLHRKLMGLM